MTKNTIYLSFLILSLIITSSILTDIAYAEDEHLSEEHDMDEESQSVEHKELSSHQTEESTFDDSDEIHHEHMGEVTEEESHVHSSVTAVTAQWIGVITLLVAAVVFGIRARVVNKRAYKHVILTLAVGVGIMHILLAPDHLIDVGIQHGIFFAIAGSTQIGFGLLFIAKPSRKLAIIGIIGTIGSIILYFVTRIGNLPEPFGAPEGIDQVGIIAKILEISMASILIYLAVYIKKTSRVKIKDSEN